MNGVHRNTVNGRTVSRGHGVTWPKRMRETWEYRHLLRHLVVRDLKVKYKRSSLGFLWTLLNPLLTVAVLVAVFSTVIRIKMDHYWAFLLSGYFVWNMIAQAISGASYVLPEHARLTRSVALPKEILVLSAMMSRVVEFTMEIAIIMLVLVVAFHHAVPAAFVVIPYLLLIQVILALGLAFPIATLCTLFSDVLHALPMLITTLFYLSPVFYSASMVPEAYRALYLANPVAGLLTMYHTVLYEGAFPSTALMLGSAAGALITLGIGYVLFARYQDVCGELV
ncbi:ABC transporter permease [bacterium]|nr:ABC transporter permease [bacterium]